MSEYKLFSENIEGSDEPGMKAYGIILYVDGRSAEVISGISCDKAAVQRLVDLFNSEGLDPVHFEQAVEDYLYDFMI